MRNLLNIVRIWKRGCSGRPFPLTFIPHHENAVEEDIEKLQYFMNKTGNILLLTGAGISTGSGIPDYRSEGVGLYARSSKRPVQFQDFMKHSHVRKRYWARNYVGWPNFSSFQPNATHKIINNWQKSGKISQIVTQNVDRLHHKTGSRSAIELHGTAFEVKCMNCDYRVERHDFQDVLEYHNPTLYITSNEIRPDGDVELSQDQVNSFTVPDCPSCRGILKPDIVFFGDNVPKEKVENIYKTLEASSALLVIGSSLQVYSGYRFVLKARELQKPVVILNIGPTRGDPHADLKVNGECSYVLSKIKV